MNDLKRDDGFTLIEVLIAIAIFSIGIMVVVSLQTNAVMKTVSARNTTEALELASAQVEFLHGLPLYDPDLDLDGDGITEPFDMPPELNAENADDHEAAVGRYAMRWTVTDNQPLVAIPNVFSTVGPDPLTISKTIVVTVADARQPNRPLATLEMIKVWDRDG